MSIRAARRALASGEIDPDLQYASDLVPVQGGAETCLNFIVRAKGGVERTPGTVRLVAAAQFDVRLAPFVRSRSAAYLAEFGPGYVRLHEADAAPGDGHVSEVVTPYTAADLPALQLVQSNDVQWIFSGRPIQELRRSGSPGAYNFALVESPVKNGPFLDQNFDKNLRIIVSGTGGGGGTTTTATLTATSDVFSNGHVGKTFAAGLASVALWKADVEYSEGRFIRWGQNVYRITFAGESGDTPPTHTSGAVFASNVGFGDTPAEFTYSYSDATAVTITAVTSATEATVEVRQGATAELAPASVVTLTATADLFAAGHVGSFWRLEEEDWAETPKWENRVNVSVGSIVRYDGNVYLCTKAGETSDSPPSHLEGVQTDSTDGNAVEWQYLHSGYGLVKITAVTDARTATAEVISQLPGQVAERGTWKWREGAWSGVRGYPAAGALYKSALWAARSEAEPYKLWKSAIEGFDDFEPGTGDDAALARGLYGGKTEAVLWMAPSSYLGIGTEGQEWVARPDESGDTVRVNNLITEAATDEGACAIPGVTIAGRTIFVDASRQRLTSMLYDFRKDGWEPKDMSLLAGHILGPGVVEIAYQRTPWPVIWCLLETGTLGALTYLRDQEVLAWHRHDFGDPVRSIAVVPVDGGRRETLFLAVDRNDTVQIERMAGRFRRETQTSAEAIYVHSAVTYDLGAPQTVFAGLDHLEGREVIALVDGKSHPPMTVTGGSVTLSFAGSRVTIGLRYESRYKTLPFDLGGLDEYQAARKKRIADLHLAFSDTLGGEVEIDGRREVVFQLGNTPLDQAPALWTGLQRVAPPAACDRGQVEYINDSPWPATMTAIFPEYEV